MIKLCQNSILKVILHYNYPVGNPANRVHEHLTAESFSQVQNQTFQQLYLLKEIHEYYMLHLPHPLAFG